MFRCLVNRLSHGRIPFGRSFSENVPRSGTADLSDRAVLSISGADAFKFLQNLFTNDLRHVTASSGIYTGLLNVQGRNVCDAFICTDQQRSTATTPVYLLDTDKAVVPKLLPLLKRYILRSKVVVDDTLPFHVRVAWGDTQTQLKQPAGSFGNVFADPRRPELGVRAIYFGGSAAEAGGTRGPQDIIDYRTLQILQAAPPSCSEVVDMIPLECNMELLNGISFQKGCFLGQELTARTYHTGVIRKRLVPVRIHRNDLSDGEEAAKIAPGMDIPDPVTKKSMGKIISLSDPAGSTSQYALALIRLRYLHSKLTVGDCTLTPLVPSWWPDEVKNAGVLEAA